MKKFIAVVAALVSISAFADHHMENRHMVRLEGYEGNRTDRSLDLFWSSDDQKPNESKEQNIALNYAYAITGAWQVGASYKKNEAEDTSKVETTTSEMGLKVIYNFAGKLSDTNWLALHYRMGEVESDTKADELENTTWALEFGHRFSLGNLWGMNFNWSPSVELAQVSTEPASAANTKDFDTQSIAINVLAVDVLF